MTTNHYIIFIVVALSIFFVIISLIDMLERKKRLKAKKETWGKLNEVSEKLKAEKDLKVWESLSDSNAKKRKYFINQTHC